MGPTVITPDVVSSVFASRECGLLLGDAREVLRTLADDSVDCTVTSPPYYSGRRHVGDTIHEIGSEKTVEEYVEALASVRSEEHTSELQSQSNLVCRLLLEKKKQKLDIVAELQCARVPHHIWALTAVG